MPAENPADEGVRAAVATHVADGGNGAVDLAEAVANACAEPANSGPPATSPATRPGVGSPARVHRQDPPCRQSHDPALKGVPADFTLAVREVRASVSAGFVYPLCGNIPTMPGVPSHPAAERIDLGEHGHIVGSRDRSRPLRRVRLEVAGIVVADSTDARLLHQPGVPAAWWFPREDVATGGLSARRKSSDHPLLGQRRLFDLHADGGVVEAVVRSHPEVAKLDGLLGVDWRRIDRAFEEDEPVAAEPIDPYHRVDVRDASRHVRLGLDGVVLAESHTPRMVFETTARPHFYVTEAEIRTDLLEPSHTQGACQYKGVSEYFHVRLPDRVVTDLVWRYRDPRDDGRRLVGRYAIHHERCDTTIDGRYSP